MNLSDSNISGIKRLEQQKSKKERSCEKTKNPVQNCWQCYPRMCRPTQKGLDSEKVRRMHSSTAAGGNGVLQLPDNGYIPRYHRHTCGCA